MEWLGSVVDMGRQLFIFERGNSIGGFWYLTVWPWHCAILFAAELSWAGLVFGWRVVIYRWRNGISRESVALFSRFCLMGCVEFNCNIAVWCHVMTAVKYWKENRIYWLGRLQAEGIAQNDTVESLIEDIKEASFLFLLINHHGMRIPVNCPYHWRWRIHFDIDPCLASDVDFNVTDNSCSYLWWCNCVHWHWIYW